MFNTCIWNTFKKTTKYILILFKSFETPVLKIIKKHKQYWLNI